MQPLQPRTGSVEMIAIRCFQQAAEFANTLFCHSAWAITHFFNFSSATVCSRLMSDFSVGYWF